MRVSTEDQAENPEGSIRNQEERLKDYIKMKSYDGDFGDLIETYCDPGISAKDMNRPAFQRMMKDIEHKKINLVMVTELSRLTRSTKDFAEINDFLKAHDCKFLSLRDNFDSTTAAGEMIMLTIANFAQFERRQLGERIANAFQARSKRGLWNGGALPLGYEVNPDKPGHLKIIPFESEIVQKVFESFLKNETLSSTGRALNAAGVVMPRKIRKGPKFRHPHFTIENVYRLLTNKAYVGVRVYKVKDEIRFAKACWEPIIDESVFARVQKILSVDAKHRKPPSPQRYPYLLSGVLYCKTCGDRLCGKSAHGRAGKIAYYEHAHFAKTQSLLVTKGLTCDPKRILAYKIEPVVWEDVKRLLTDEAYARMIFEDAKLISKAVTNDSLILKLNHKIKLNSAHTESLVKRIAVLPEGLDAKPFYDEIKNLQEDSLRLRTELEVFKSKNYSQNRNLSFEDFQKFTVNLKTLAETETRPEAKAAIIRKIVSSIHVTPDGIEIQYHASRDHFKTELGGAAPGSSTSSKVITNPIKISFNKPHTKPLNKYSESHTPLGEGFSASSFFKDFCSKSLIFGSERRT